MPARFASSIKQSIQYVIYGTLQSAMQSVSVRGAGGALARSHARTLARSHALTHALTARTARSHAHTNAHTPPPRLCSRLFLSARLPHTRAARAALASRIPPTRTRAHGSSPFRRLCCRLCRRPCRRHPCRRRRPRRRPCRRSCRRPCRRPCPAAHTRRAAALARRLTRGAPPRARPSSASGAPSRWTRWCPSCASRWRAPCTEAGSFSGEGGGGARGGGVPSDSRRSTQSIGNGQARGQISHYRPHLKRLQRADTFMRAPTQERHASRTRV